MKFKWIGIEDCNLEIVDGDRGSNYPKHRDFFDTGYCLFLNAKNVTENGFDFEQIQFVTKERDELLRKGKLKRNDVVLTTRGTVGNVALYDEAVPFEHVRINSGMVIFRPDQNKHDSRFIYYILRSNLFQEQVKVIVSGTAQPQLPIRDIKQLKIPNLTLKEQKDIADVIGALDSKLRLNRQINQTLEQVAQAIFKSWFVDFEPVKAKIEAKENGQDPERAAMRAISGKSDEELDQLPADQRQQLAAAAAQFPRELVASEIGSIPAMWSAGNLNDVCHLNMRSWTNANAPSEVRYVDLANTKNGVIEEVQNYNWPDAPSRARRILSPGDTIVGTVRPGNRSFALIGNDEMRLTGSTGFAVLSPKTEENVEFVYIAATSDANIERLEHLADGAAYPAVRPDVVAEFQCVIPTNDVMKAFSEITKPLFSLRHRHLEQIAILTTCRDILLPKLMSGDLEIKKV